jgi:hypothetical protein
MDNKQQWDCGSEVCNARNSVCEGQQAAVGLDNVYEGQHLRVGLDNVWWDCGSVMDNERLQWTMSSVGLRFARDNVCENEWCGSEVTTFVRDNEQWWHLQWTMSSMGLRFARDSICKSGGICNGQ